MKKNKILTIPIVLIMVLAFCGIAYAHWFDQVHIEGVTKGGTVNIAFDWEEPPKAWELYREYAGGPLVEGEYLGKDVGKFLVWRSDFEEDVHTGKYGYETLNIDIECAYPCYRLHTTYKVHNIGTIPVNICRYIITGEKREKETDEVIYNLIFVPITADGRHGELWEDVNGDNKIDPTADPQPDKLVINIWIENGIPYQLDPCNTEKHEIDLHFKQDAQQCHRYTIHVKILGLQWNKDCTAFVLPADG